MALATAAGGMEVGQVIAGRERYSVLIRCPRALRGTPERIGNILVAAPSDAQVALDELTRIRVVNGSTLIKAVGRVRPKMMTVTAIIAGLVPILWSQGAGADVMKRIAAPMVGGMLSSTLLTLVVIPAIYSLWKERGLQHAVVPIDHIQLVQA
jgi:Cu/Ag efflux pump CusA